MRDTKLPKKSLFNGINSKNKLIRQLLKLYIFEMGHLLYLFLILTKGHYKGNQKFYRIAQQSNGHFGKVTRGFLTLKSFADMFSFYKFYLNEFENQRLSSVAIEHYSDSTLSGYGSKEFKKGGDKIENQQRGLILPKLTECIKNSEERLKILEIGTGNGDVLNHVQSILPEHKYIGIDFVLTNAKDSYPDNIIWEEGYALDLISNVSPDLVFSSSTWVFFTPAELESYLSKLASNNCKNIIISEPLWGSKYLFNEEDIESFHLEYGVWLHNWPAYFSKYGFKCIDKEVFSYKHQISPRPDIRIFIGHWKLI